jgi:AraC family transcriptional regulator
MNDASFIGAELTARRAGPFALGHWRPTSHGGGVGDHEHREAHFMFIVAGEFESSTSPHSPPVLIYNPPRTTHRDRFVTAHGTFFSVAINDEVLDAADVDLPRVPRAIECPSAVVLMMRLICETAHWRSDSADVVEDLCRELLHVVAVPEEKLSAPGWLLDVKRVVEREPGRIAVRELSESVGVHRGHLSRAFRQHFGCSPAELARATRLRAAATLLATTRMPLSEISLETGFADQSHLTQQFRRTFGLTPGQYRPAAHPVT